METIILIIGFTGFLIGWVFIDLIEELIKRIWNYFKK